MSRRQFDEQAGNCSEYDSFFDDVTAYSANILRQELDDIIRADHRANPEAWFKWESELKAARAKSPLWNPNWRKVVPCAKS